MAVSMRKLVYIPIPTCIVTQTQVLVLAVQGSPWHASAAEMWGLEQRIPPCSSFFCSAHTLTVAPPLFMFSVCMTASAPFLFMLALAAGVAAAHTHHKTKHSSSCVAAPPLFVFMLVLSQLSCSSSRPPQTKQCMRNSTTPVHVYACSLTVGVAAAHAHHRQSIHHHV